jgi:CubicO group peptidase (beta-lactamase class C family)
MSFRSLLLSCFLLISIRLWGQVPSDSLHARLDAYFVALASIDNFNGNVIIAQHGKVLLDQTYNMPGQIAGMHVTHDSRSIIASVSKAFVKFAVLRLAQLGKLALSDKINRFIPDFPRGDEISIDHLMHHQSGLPRELSNSENDDSISLQKAVELAKLEKLQFAPGTQTLYSNIGFSLLHQIIDRASKHGYNDFMEKEVFRKLKLRHTGEFNASKSVPDFVFGFDKNEGKVRPAPIEDINRFETGNVACTVADLYRFATQIVNGKILIKSLAMNMFNADSVLMQAGGRPGYRAFLYKDLKTEVDFVFVANYTDIPIEQVSADVVKILQGNPYEIPHRIDRVAIALSPEILQRYTGKFALLADLNETFEIRMEEGHLLLVDDADETSALLPDSETTFFDDAHSMDGFNFALNPQTGQYDLVVVSTGMQLKTRKLD